MPTLFAGPVKFAVARGGKAATLSGLYPSVPLPEIADEALAKLVKPRSPGTPMKKQVKASGRIEGSRIDAGEFAARLPFHRSTLWTIAARAGLTDKEQPKLDHRRRAYDGEFETDGHSVAGQVELAQEAEADDLEAAILQVLTHPSFFESSASDPANAEPIPSTTPLAPRAAALLLEASEPAPAFPKDNSLLAATGRAITDLVLTEYLMKRFPNLPTKSLGYAVTALTNQGALVDVGRELAIGFVAPSQDFGQEDQNATGAVVRYRRLASNVRPLCAASLLPERALIYLSSSCSATGGADGREARAQVPRRRRGRPGSDRPRLRAPGSLSCDRAHQAAFRLALARPQRPRQAARPASVAPRDGRPLRPRAACAAAARRERSALGDPYLRCRHLLGRHQARRGFRLAHSRGSAFGRSHCFPSFVFDSC